MTVLQAVLDTQFWLATHVVCITLGYAATFVAGLLGIIYILRGVLHAGADAGDAATTLARMIYGTLCFAMFFSFVGTVLGGLWADDSWGRFWGWDPKENGALIIVLWNALVLHARWGGMVKDRGLAVLAVLGNIVTAWSWFGVNELGVGLHSYGFTEGVATGPGAFRGVPTGDHRLCCLRSLAGAWPRRPRQRGRVWQFTNPAAAVKSENSLPAQRQWPRPCGCHLAQTLSSRPIPRAIVVWNAAMTPKQTLFEDAAAKRARRRNRRLALRNVSRPGGRSVRADDAQGRVDHARRQAVLQSRAFATAPARSVFPSGTIRPGASIAATQWKPGTFYKLRAIYRETNFGPQLDIRKIREVFEADAADGFSPPLCLPQSRFDRERCSPN